MQQSVRVQHVQTNLLFIPVVKNTNVKRYRGRLQWPSQVPQFRGDMMCCCILKFKRRG